MTTERRGPVSARPGPTEPDRAPVLPDITSDERDEGWGERRSDADERRRRDEWLERERPPHHEG